MSKEKQIIVDENNQVIGHKERGAMLPTDIYRVSALWVENSKGEVLIAQRKMNKKKDPGKWGPAVAGTVDEGETYESNIYKEAEEEIGLTGVPFNFGPDTFKDDEGDRFFGQWFTCVVDLSAEDFTIQEEEVEQLQWIDKEKLFEELKTDPEKYVPSAHMWEELFK